MRKVSELRQVPDPQGPEKGPGTPYAAPRQPRKAKRFDRESTRLYIEDADRLVFVDYLVDCLSGAPSVQEIRRFARRNPAHWAQMAVMLSKLTGYRDQVDVRAESRDFRTLSDAEVELRARAMVAQIIPQIPENIDESHNPNYARD